MCDDIPLLEESPRCMKKRLNEEQTDEEPYRTIIYQNKSILPPIDVEFYTTYQFEPSEYNECSENIDYSQGYDYHSYLINELYIKEFKQQRVDQKHTKYICSTGRYLAQLNLAEHKYCLEKYLRQSTINKLAYEFALYQNSKTSMNSLIKRNFKKASRIIQTYKYIDEIGKFTLVCDGTDKDSLWCYYQSVLRRSITAVVRVMKGVESAYKFGAWIDNMNSVFRKELDLLWQHIIWNAEYETINHTYYENTTSSIKQGIEHYLEYETKMDKLRNVNNNFMDDINDIQYIYGNSRDHTLYTFCITNAIGLTSLATIAGYLPIDILQFLISQLYIITYGKFYFENMTGPDKMYHFIQ